MKRHVAPGYCVVEQPGTLDFQARQLFRNTRSPAVPGSTKPIWMQSAGCWRTCCIESAIRTRSYRSSAPICA
ncbi:hypothetical protein B1H58_09235 [Pantoea alhagi]|uniref:Uncharacterized protein n=1 Tax=Pantoea alhagi TaxID=1891675 RepID=A0A1W6B506_9GAMM|nr:hypothetical protein B1H58_09235 [Pantoea alhagi]